MNPQNKQICSMRPQYIQICFVYVLFVCAIQTDMRVCEMQIDVLYESVMKTDTLYGSTTQQTCCMSLKLNWHFV